MFAPTGSGKNRGDFCHQLLPGEMSSGVIDEQASAAGDQSASLLKQRSSEVEDGNEMSDRKKRKGQFRFRTPPADTALSVMHENEYLVCISDRVNEFERYPFEGCEDIMEQVMKSISRGDSVLVVGEPGRGKRTLSLGLARKLAALRESADSQKSIYSCHVYTLSLGSSFWNRTTQEDISEVQEHIREVFRLVETAGPEKIVFCIDDVDILSFVDDLAKEPPRSGRSGSPTTTSGSGLDVLDSAMSTENMLRYLLFNRKVVCLCTCIRGAYQRLIHSDTFYDEKFTKTFRVLYMPEPTVEQTLQIVRAHRTRIEAEFGVVLPDETLRAAVAYAKNYLTHREMPESALDILYEASRAAVQEGLRDDLVSSPESGSAQTAKVVGRQFVDAQITKWCGYTNEQLQLSLVKEGILP